MPFRPLRQVMGGVREVEVRLLGQVDYAEAQQLMLELQVNDCLKTFQTLFYSAATLKLSLSDPGARRDGVIVPTDYLTNDKLSSRRGITWHGPGQLVVYPIFKWDLEGESNVKKITSKLEQYCSIASIGH